MTIFLHKHARKRSPTQHPLFNLPITVFFRPVTHPARTATPAKTQKAGPFVRASAMQTAHEQKGRLKPTHQGRATHLKPISTYSLPRYFSNCGLKPIWSGA